MVKKPEKPDSRNNYKKTKPKKDRAFLFGSKKWSADEYFGSDDDLQIEANDEDDAVNNSYFAEDDDSRSKRKSSARFTARRSAPKINSSFFSDEDDNGAEEEASLPFVADEVESNVEIADKASIQLEQDTHEVVEEEKPKKQGLFSSRKKHTEHIADNTAEQESVLDTEEAKQEGVSDSGNTIPTANNQRKRKRHNDLFSKLEDVEFEATELPEEVLSTEAAADETAEEHEPKKGRGLFARFDKEEKTPVDEDIADETIDEENTAHKKKVKGLFSRSTVEETKESEEPIETITEVQTSDDDKQEAKPRRRKDHSSLLNSLKQVEFEGSEVPQEVLMAEAEETKAQVIINDIGMSTSSEEDQESSNEQVEEQQETSEKTMKRSFLSHFLKDEEPDDLLKEEQQDEAVLPLEEEVQEEAKSLDENSVLEEKQENKPLARRKDHSALLDRLNEVTFEESEVPEEVLIEDASEDEEYEQPKKRRGLFARLEENEAEDYFEADEITENTDVIDNNKNLASEPIAEQTTRRKRTDSVLKEVEEIAAKPLTVQEEDVMEEEEQPKSKRRGLFAQSKEADELDEVLGEDEDVFSSPKRRRYTKKRRNKRVSSKQVNIDEVMKETEEDKPLVKPAAASLSSIMDEESEPKKRARKPVGKRETSFTDILAAVKNIMPSRKSDNKALTFAEVNKHNKKIKTRRIFIYAGTGILAAAVALVFIFVPLGKPVDTQPSDDSMVAISDPVDTDDPTQDPIDIPTPEPDPTPEVVQTPIVTTPPDPTHQTINIDAMVEDFKVEADLYYNQVGYSTNYYKYTENEMYMLAQLIHGEARGESLDGMVAVGNVVMNRVLNRRVFGNSIKSVITAPSQFTGYDPDDVPSSKCKIAARKVLDFQVWVVPQNVYYFKSGASAGQNWGSHKFYTEIGGHCFYTHNYGGRSSVSDRPPRMFERTYMWPRMGCKPEDRVYMIQFMLNGLGYDVKADSYFGEGTMEELKKFQEKKGLDADGVAGPSTIEALIREYGIEEFYVEFYT